jgi:tripartite-type tricarboxylate transporter receptor subunit TctC
LAPVLSSHGHGGTDAFARLLAQALGKQVGQTVIVDNRPGAGGLLAGGVVAQSAPDFNYASTGNGTPQHLAMEIFMDKTGLKVQHVPYKGGSPGITATSTGEVQMFFIIES